MDNGRIFVTKHVPPGLFLHLADSAGNGVRFKKCPVRFAFLHLAGSAGKMNFVTELLPHCSRIKAVYARNNCQRFYHRIAGLIPYGAHEHAHHSAHAQPGTEARLCHRPGGDVVRHHLCFHHIGGVEFCVRLAHNIRKRAAVAGKHHPDLFRDGRISYQSPERVEARQDSGGDSLCERFCLCVSAHLFQCCHHPGLCGPLRPLLVQPRFTRMGITSCRNGCFCRRGVVLVVPDHPACLPSAETFQP